MNSRLAWALSLIAAGVATSVIALWDRTQSCEQIEADVLICTYTALNYVLLGVGGLLVVAGAALIAADRRRSHSSGD